MIKQQEQFPFTECKFGLGPMLSMIVFSPEEGAVITQLLQRRMLQFRKIKQLVEVHGVRKQGGWAWHPGCLTSELLFLICMLDGLS